MLLFYSNTISPRLQYIVDFFSDELFDEPIQIITDAELFRQSIVPKLNYSDRDFSEKEFFYPQTTLLFEKGIRTQDVECFDLNFHKAFLPPMEISPSIFLRQAFI
jgi:hypothetical protein